MKTEIKDNSYCMQGQHTVPREKMTYRYSDNRKVKRRICIDCNEAMDKRKETKGK
jgi:hypothetical protein